MFFNVFLDLLDMYFPEKYIFPGFLGFFSLNTELVTLHLVE